MRHDEQQVLHGRGGDQIHLEVSYRDWVLLQRTVGPSIVYGTNIVTLHPQEALFKASIFRLQEEGMAIECIANFIYSYS